MKIRQMVFPFGRIMVKCSSAIANNNNNSNINNNEKNRDNIYFRHKKSTKNKMKLSKRWTKIINIRRIHNLFVSNSVATTTKMTIRLCISTTIGIMFGNSFCAPTHPNNMVNFSRRQDENLMRPRHNVHCSPFISTENGFSLFRGIR